MKRKKLLLVATGGTITMVRGPDGGIRPALDGAELLKAVPSIGDHGNVDIVNFSCKPGASLTLADVVSISALIDERLAAGYAGAIVVQGTDTIEETAFVLDLLVRSEKPVVVSGAMRGADAAGADGPANLLAAVIVAQDDAAAGGGTLVVLNDEIHAARHVQKMHTALPSAFASPAGPLGWVVEGRARWQSRVSRRQTLARPADIEQTRVGLIKLALGDDGAFLEAAAGIGLSGVVVEAMGAGHVPQGCVDKISRLCGALPVVLASRVPAGPVFTRTYGFAGSEIDLLGRGCLPAGGLSAVKSVMLLRLLLAHGLSGERLHAAFAACAG